MTDDQARCAGYPQPRDAVRPCELCQSCGRWRDGERAPYFVTPPATQKGDVVRCEFYRAD